MGLCLGDGSVSVRERTQGGKYKFTSAELLITHGVSQKEYLEHKAALVKKCLGGNFTIREKPNGKNGAYRCYKFSSSNRYYKVLKGFLYKDGKKKFTREVLGMLSDESVALWYMDDGSARRNRNATGRITSIATEISTMCSEEEVDTIIAWFKEKYGVTFNKRFNKRCSAGFQWFIQANTEQSRKFVSIVAPWIIPSMEYKIQHVDNLDSHECGAPIGSCDCGKPIYENRRGWKCTSCYSRLVYYRNKRKFGEDMVRTGEKRCN